MLFWLFSLTGPGFLGSMHFCRGAVAQLGERLNGIQEVRSSILLSSTRMEIRVSGLPLRYGGRRRARQTCRVPVPSPTRRQIPARFHPVPPCRHLSVPAPVRCGAPLPVLLPAPVQVQDPLSRRPLPFPPAPCPPYRRLPGHGCDVRPLSVPLPARPVALRWPSVSPPSPRRSVPPARRQPPASADAPSPPPSGLPARSRLPARMAGM